MRKYSGLIGGALGLIVSVNAHAWVAAGHYHGEGYGYGRYNYNGGWANHGVVIGVPEGAYYGYGCGMVQTCEPNGCMNRRVCE